MNKRNLNVLSIVGTLFVVLASAYFIFRPQKTTVDYSRYDIARQLLANSDRATEFKRCRGEAYLTKKDADYVVNVVIARATETLNNVAILALDGEKPAADVVYPSVGLLGDEQYNLVPVSTGKSADKPSFLLSFTSNDAVATVFVYFAYDYNGERVEEYVELIPKM